MKTNIKSSSPSPSFSSSNRVESTQLDLGLDGDPAQPRCSKTALRRRHSQASVWFRRMREIVDSAKSPEVWSVKLGVSAPARPVQPLLGPALSHERHLTE